MSFLPLLKRPTTDQTGHVMSMLILIAALIAAVVLVLNRTDARASGPARRTGFDHRIDADLRRTSDELRAAGQAEQSPSSAAGVSRLETAARRRTPAAGNSYHRSQRWSPAA